MAKLATVFYGFNVIITRRLRTTDSSATMAYCSTLIYLLAAFILAPFAILVGDLPDARPSVGFLLQPWAMPSLLDLLIMSGLGLIWATSMYFIARAYGLAEASVAAPFEYAALLFNLMWGFAIWREIPTWLTVAGALLTLFSGLYVLKREGHERPAQVTRGDQSPGDSALAASASGMRDKHQPSPPQSKFS